MSVYAENIPDVLPGFLEARVLADAFYSDIYVLVVNRGDKENDTLKKFATKLGKDGKIGVALLILPVTKASDNNPNYSSGPMDLGVSFQVWEEKQTNESTSGVGKSGWRVARHTYDLFKNFAVQGVVKNLKPVTPAIVDVPPPEGKKLEGWDITFTALEDHNFVTQGINQPTFSPVSGPAATVQIACTTAGVAIWYTTDGTPPKINGASSTLYAGPINIPAGSTTIFATAFKAGNFPSNTISSTFTH